MFRNLLIHKSKIKMDLQQILENKKVLKSDIEILINKFKQETGINNVYVDTVIEEFDGNERQYIVLEIKL